MREQWHMNKVSLIESWLENVEEANPKDHVLDCCYDCEHRHRGDDSNSQSSSDSSATRSVKRPPSRRLITSIMASGSSARAKKLTRSSQLHEPPKRFHLSPVPKKQNARGPQAVSQGDCTALNEQPTAHLSPKVESHRKGNHPHRKRCESYYDDDILPHLSSKRSGCRIEGATANADEPT